MRGRKTATLADSPEKSMPSLAVIDAPAPFFVQNFARKTQEFPEFSYIPDGH
jgi:hypothetical protein